MTAPCKGCPDRSPTCHGGCEKYRKYKAARAAANARYREQMAAEETEIMGKARRARKGRKGQWTSGKR